MLQIDTAAPKQVLKTSISVLLGQYALNKNFQVYTIYCVC